MKALFLSHSPPSAQEPHELFSSSHAVHHEAIAASSTRTAGLVWVGSRLRRMDFAARRRRGCVMRVAVGLLIPTKDPTRESPEKNHHHAVGGGDLLVVLHVARRKPPAAAARQRVAAVACTDGLPRQQLPKRSGQQRCLELSGQESWRARRFDGAIHLEGPRHVADVLHGGDAGTLGKGRHRRGWLPLHR